MIRRLFGETEEEQFKYLQPRLIVLAVGVVALLIGALLIQLGVSLGEIIGGLGTFICVIDMLVFGWAIMRGLFGFTTVASMFSSNIVLGIVIFTVFIVVGYFGGFVVALIGLCRFLVLLKKRKGNN